MALLWLFPEGPIIPLPRRLLVAFWDGDESVVEVWDDGVRGVLDET